MANRSYLELAVELGFKSDSTPVLFQLYSEPLQRFRLAAEGHGPVLPPEADRARIATYFDPLPFWYTPFEEARVAGEAFPLHALTQRPMHMYHSWHSQNAWLRQITSQNRLFMSFETAAALDILDDDWVWIESHHGKVRGQVRLIDGVNPNTVWTWNAIAKRRGAWMLKEDAWEADRAFLLNHAISELLPPDGDGRRFSNSDPVTGQAAWFDLRVNVRKCTDGRAGSEPQLRTLGSPASLKPAPSRLSFGAQFRRLRETMQ
jgi:anaerobic selenocysteine-containing dehydrogenase